MSRNRSQVRRPSSFVTRWRNTLLGGGALALATVGWAFEEPAAAPPSATLNGILPSEVPFGLTSDDFSRLTGNWEEWAGGASTAVEQLFREHDSLESLQADLANVETKLATMQKALNDSRYKSVQGPLSDLYGALRRRVDVAKAILDAELSDPSKTHAEHVKSAFSNLKSALSGLKSDLSKYGNGSVWLTFVRANELESMISTEQPNPEVLDAVKTRLAGRSTAPDEAQRNFLQRDSFIKLERAIDGVLDVSATPDASAYLAQVQETGAALMAAIEEYEARNDELSAKAIREQYNKWRTIAADGGAEMSTVLRTHYLNYNFRIVASEGFVQRLYRQRRQESSWVNDRVMEARVTGYQCTDSQIDVDVRPSTGQATFALKLNGTVQSNTQGFTDQATVHTVGYHTFNAEKDIFFDGHTFSTAGCRMSVGVNNRTVDARTNIRIPIIKGIANGIARREVEKRKPQTDAITRDKIVSQLRPRLDKEVSENLAKGTTQLEAKVYGPLRELESYPQDMDTSSTDDAIIVRARLMESEELGGGEWPRMAMPSQGIVLQAHESLLNNAIERAHFAGREMTQQELNDELKARMEKLLGRKLDAEKVEEPATAEPTPAEPPAEGDAPAAEETKADENAKFVFDSHDAIRFNVSDGEVRIIMRAGLKREGADPIPTQIIEVPLGFVVEGDQIIVSRKGEPAIRPVDRGGNRAEQIVRANVMRANIRRLLPERKLKATMALKQDNKEIQLRITDVVPRDGWVTVLAR